MPTLQFGLSVPVRAATDADPIGLARSAEDLGFDFVSVTDHPGSSEPGYEAWTLLTWIAAATSRIRIASKVLCGPLRVPALTAKMAESLHRLSDGRLVLGLGAGYSDQEIGSFGLESRSARDKVDALEESLHIIRGLWTQPKFTYTGRIYRTDDAQVVPSPDRAIPIWLGTYGERALELTGRLADGWIPSLGFAPPDAVAVMREKVLAATERAGRDPDVFTCAYNLELCIGSDLRDPTIVSGSPAQVIDRLLEFTKLGFTVLNFSFVGPDEDHQRELLAHEIVPAVRAVA